MPLQGEQLWLQTVASTSTPGQQRWLCKCLATGTATTIGAPPIVLLSPATSHEHKHKQAPGLFYFHHSASLYWKIVPFRDTPSRGVKLSASPGGTENPGPSRRRRWT